MSVVTKQSSNPISTGSSRTPTNRGSGNRHKTFVGKTLKVALNKTKEKMADDEDIAALVVDNGSGMCKGEEQLSVVLQVHSLVI